MNTAALNAVSVMTNGNGALQSARMNKESSDFASLLGEFATNYIRRIVRISTLLYCCIRIQRDYIFELINS